MKPFTIILLFITSLALFSCDTNDDGFYNAVYLDSTNLVSIATTTNYAVGDKIYLQSNFSRYQVENGQSEFLDIYKTTGNAAEFTFSYVIEKQVNETLWQVVTVSDSQLDVIEGDAQNGSYVFGHCIYNPVSETYNYNVGFPLLATGQYRLSFGYNSSSSNLIELRSTSAAGKLILNINSTNAQIANNGYYNFIVN